VQFIRIYYQTGFLLNLAGYPGRHLFAVLNTPSWEIPLAGSTSVGLTAPKQ
jgi:hypothetical protein